MLSGRVLPAMATTPLPLLLLRRPCSLWASGRQRPSDGSCMMWEVDKIYRQPSPRDLE